MDREELYQEIAQIPIIDVHSHLNRGQLTPPSIDKILLYHMVMYPLRSAGVPEEMLWPGKGKPGPDRKELYRRFAEAWPGMVNTGFAQMLEGILRELYDFDEPVTIDSLPRLEEIFDKKTAEPEWPKEVMRRCNIVRVFSSQVDVPPLENGQWDGGIRFTVEATLINHVIEHKLVGDQLQGAAGATGVEIASYDDLQKAVNAYYDKYDWSDKSAMVAWMGSIADFTPVDRSYIDQIIRDARSGKNISTEDKGLFEAALVRCMCNVALQKAPTFQLVYGTQRLGLGKGNMTARALPQFSSTIPYLLNEYPEIHFNVLNGYELDEPVLCTLCTGYKNFSLSNFWWHSFYPSAMYHGWHRRLEMCPASRLVGFFSDGWNVEWTWARAMMVRRVLSRVLGDKVEQGFYTRDEAVAIARRLFFETPRRIFCGDEVLPETIQ